MNYELIPGKLYLFKKQDLYNWYINDINRLLFLEAPSRLTVCKHLVFLKKEKIAGYYDFYFLHETNIIKRIWYSYHDLDFFLRYWVINND